MLDKVLLSASAERDLEELYDYISAADTRERADYALDRLLETAQGIAHSPLRGAHPRELLALGIFGYRQVYFKPYHVIYRVMNNRVVIDVIVDGRRDMQASLERRLLGR
jgi:toxin ParE1/3/4